MKNIYDKKVKELNEIKERLKEKELKERIELYDGCKIFDKIYEIFMFIIVFILLIIIVLINN